tara:strand:+ start:2888 stop:3088 length:201 start_codon:yes stop_codon:yes gene_type:complete
MKIKILIIIICVISSPAHAYIDPGSGSIIVQALMFIIAAFGVFYGYIKNKIKSIYEKLFKKKDKSL